MIENHKIENVISDFFYLYDGSMPYIRYLEEVVEFLHLISIKSFSNEDEIFELSKKLIKHRIVEGSEISISIKKSKITLKVKLPFRSSPLSVQFDIEELKVLSIGSLDHWMGGDPVPDYYNILERLIIHYEEQKSTLTEMVREYQIPQLFKSVDDYSTFWYFLMRFDLTDGSGKKLTPKRYLTYFISHLYRMGYLNLNSFSDDKIAEIFSCGEIDGWSISGRRLGEFGTKTIEREFQDSVLRYFPMLPNS